MGQEDLKLELIEWIINLEDEETIGYLKTVKDAIVSHEDWGNDLTDEQKSGIERGLKDIEEGNVIPHEVVKRKYDLTD